MIQCAHCGIEIDTNVGIVTLSLQSPRVSETYHFCTGLCLAPWLTKANDAVASSTFKDIMRKFGHHEK